MKTKATSKALKKQGIRYSLAAVVLASTLGTISTAANAATLTGNFGLVSDSVFRGISQTDEGMALQGGFTLGFENGFYLSTWGSSIKFGEGSMELDLLAGWAGAINEDWSTDIGIMQYRYPQGDNQTDQFNFTEIYGKLLYKDLVLGLAYSDDYFGSGVNEYYYLSADYTYPLNDDLSLLLHLGHNKFEDNAQYNTFIAAGPLNGSSYLDWSLGVGTTILGASAQLKYAATSIDNKADCNLCDGRLVLSLSKTF